MSKQKLKPPINSIHVFLGLPTNIVRLSNALFDGTDGADNFSKTMTGNSRDLVNWTVYGHKLGTTPLETRARR